MDAVESNLGGIKVKVCGVVQYINLFGVGIGYTVAAAISAMAIKRSNCFHSSHGKDPCHMNSNIYMISFGAAEIILSQIPDFHELWWLSIVAAVMSFTYSFIGLGLGIGKVVGNKKIKGGITGVAVGTITQTQKIWKTFQALGNIAFAYSYSMILIEIQDTVKSGPPSEAKTMQKATLISVLVTTFFYMLCGCFGYAAFGDSSPGNLLTGFGFYNPYWLIDIANIAIIVHLVGAYQVYCQPLFSFIEINTAKIFPNSGFITKEFEVPIPGCNAYKFNLFRLIWRTIFVIITTVVAMLLPFFNDIVGLIGAIGFWPLTVYFPVEMYITQQKIPKLSLKWICLEMLSFACLMVSLAAAVGSIAGIVDDVKDYKPFQTNY
ncbi:unnamed protein product [Lupinus luteus]|uniref:Amino acid transporter transmembrane domain-containing protein n=1 Tax=Lupinus luteus TaxID=3873 RepID=A0AAV1WEV1_LUPLU